MKWLSCKAADKHSCHFKLQWLRSFIILPHRSSKFCSSHQFPSRCWPRAHCEPGDWHIQSENSTSIHSPLPTPPKKAIKLDNGGRFDSQISVYIRPSRPYCNVTLRIVVKKTLEFVCSIVITLNRNVPAATSKLPLILILMFDDQPGLNLDDIVF